MHDFTNAEIGKYAGKIAGRVPAFPSVLPPVGQRPKCLFCARELRPNFSDPRPNIGSGYVEYMSQTKSERKAWAKAHPKVFLGTYGEYTDSRFCGLRCGYKFALQHTTVDTMDRGKRWR